MTRAPDETVTLTVWANATNVSGYQSRITFDPDVVTVTAVSGTADFDAPVANVDNENGSVTFNQIRASETTDPLLAEVTVDIVGTDGQQSDLSFDPAETKFSNETGGTFEPANFRSLTIAVESTTSTETATATETTTATPTENTTTETTTAAPTETETATATATPTPDTDSNTGGSDDDSDDSNSNAESSGGGGVGGGGSASSGTDRASPSFHISSMEITRIAAIVGDEITVQAHVRNRGGDGTYTVQFAVNETSVETAEIDLDAGENRTITFTHQVSDPGTYEFSLNGRIAGTTNVTAATSSPTPTDQVTDTVTPTTTDLST